MDVDGEEYVAEDDSEIVPEVRVSLVGQDDLESTCRAKFLSITNSCLWQVSSLRTRRYTRCTCIVCPLPLSS